MNYFDWNYLIAQHFFNPTNAGKDIYFYLTKQDLIKYSRQSFDMVSDDEIWEDFIYAIKYDDQEDDNSKLQFSPIEKPLQLFAQWNKTDIPPFLAYLILYIMPLTETYEEHFSIINYYGKVNLFFKKYGILNNFTEENIWTGNFQRISHLWNDLEEWAIITMNCDLGIFELKKFGNPNWIHVGKPFSQCILPPNAINKLPELFYESGLIPNSLYTKEEFRNFLLKYGSKILSLKDSVLELIRKSEINELGQSIIEIVNREYSKWTGESHQDGDDGLIHKTIRNYTVAPLFLQFQADENEGQIYFSYRIYSLNEYPEDLKFGEYEDLYEINGWSKTLNMEFKEPFELRDDFNKWVARFPSREVRLFVNAGTFQLSTRYWIERESLSKTDFMFLLCKNEKRNSIMDWGKTFSNGNFRVEDFEGLPEGYSLFKILYPVTSHPNIPLLAIYTEKKIELTGGLKTNFRTLVNDFLPEIEINNSNGYEKVYLQYRNNEEKIFLKKKLSKSNRSLLPADITLDVEFHIKVEGENLAGNEIAYKIISTGNSALRVAGTDLPKRDCFGKQITNGLLQYCLGSNIINPGRASQRYYCPWGNLFMKNSEDFTNEIITATYHNHCGNMLSGFLSLRGTLTTEEFYTAFEFYFTKVFPNRQVGVNFNLTRIKKSSLNFYDYIGFLDYDYETKKIVVNPPQLIFIPVHKGRMVLLIGGRDPAFINSIITTAAKHNLQVEIVRQFSTNDFLLLPDVITIKAFGKRTEGFGEVNINAFADELRINFSRNDFLQVALLLFSADINQYENELLSNNQTSQEDYGWARKIFNYESLIYEKNESPEFDKTFSLVEYKLNEYTFIYKLWIKGMAYLVDRNWGGYLALKYYNNHVILFDSDNDRVAIPLEMPLPRLLAESLMLLSGLAPEYKIIGSRQYRVYENIPGIFTENLFQKLGQKPVHQKLKS